MISLRFASVLLTAVIFVTFNVYEAWTLDLAKIGQQFGEQAQQIGEQVSTAVRSVAKDIANGSFIPSG